MNKCGICSRICTSTKMKCGCVFNACPGCILEKYKYHKVICRPTLPERLKTIDTIYSKQKYLFLSRPCYEPLGIFHDNVDGMGCVVCGGKGSSYEYYTKELIIIKNGRKLMCWRCSTCRTLDNTLCGETFLPSKECIKKSLPFILFVMQEWLGIHEVASIITMTRLRLGECQHKNVYKRGSINPYKILRGQFGMDGF